MFYTLYIANSLLAVHAKEIIQKLKKKQMKNTYCSFNKNFGTSKVKWLGLYSQLDLE